MALLRRLCLPLFVLALLVSQTGIATLEVGDGHDPTGSALPTGARSVGFESGLSPRHPGSALGRSSGLLHDFLTSPGQRSYSATVTGPGYVSKTVVLYNESVQPGTVPAYPVSGVDALALDTANHHLWVVGYNLGSLNLTTGLEDMGELGGTYSTSATHLLYVPSTDQILEMFVTGGNVSVYWANNGTYVRNLTLPGGPYDASSCGIS